MESQVSLIKVEEGGRREAGMRDSTHLLVLKMKRPWVASRSRQR